ncbi:MAG: type II toxin-antitoxin system RelE/ParE family toxin [Thermodesulfobacteriota bacterium]|nr:type II toxin-antitoxin system RelE/ParE family toxin [Thermodesulfobacteriota bacterium]
MAFYSIVWKQSAQKELQKVNKKAIPKIIQAVEALSLEPHPAGSRKLHGADHTYRLRTGSYRIVYSVYPDIITIEIIRVGHRKDIYRNLPRR